MFGDNTKGFLGIRHHKLKAFLIILASLMASQSYAQFGDFFGFGKNKVHHKNFHWSTIKTEHFDLYFYDEEREAAMDAAEIAERSYAYLSEILDYRFKKKIPLLLYASHNDFQQTNAIQGDISEGTQGVTESLKGRMVLPITGSYAQFVHVLTHEMVHAFQFSILLADSPADLVRRFNPPLWFTEGMAEYLSVGMDNITRMWMRDAVLNNMLLTLPEMSQVFDIRVYRMGQAIWYYVGERYGKEVVGRIFKTARATGEINRAFKAHTGLDLIELSRRWQEDARSRYLPEKTLLKKPAEVAQQVTFKTNQFTNINIVPSLSPDGTELAYVGDKDFLLNIFVKDLDGKGKVHKIVEGGTSQSYESLRYFDTSMNWSPDGRFFSFVAKAGKNDAIYIVDAKKRKVVKRFIFRNLTGMAAPSWSPDGHLLVFTGLDGGRSDLYIVDENGSNLRSLTKDRYAYLQPQWSPDGKKIAYVTDRGPNTHVDQMIFGDYNIAIYDLETKKSELFIDAEGDQINPVWTKNGDRLLFISDITGIPNIYSKDVATGAVYQITNFITGVAGIISQSPAISLAVDTGRLAFSAFTDGGWNIFLMDQYEEQRVDAQVTEVLEPLENPNDKYLEYELPDSSDFNLTKYSAKISPDLIIGGGGFASNVGFAGQSAFLFSDMLGDRNLIIQTALFGDLLESTIIATYLNQKRRLNWAVTAFQFRNDFGLFTAQNSSDFVSQVYRGVSIAAARPFSRFSRVEFSTDFFILEESVVSANFLTGQLQNVGGSTAFFSTFNSSLVVDTAFWGLAAPISGTRAKLTASQTVGDLSFTNLILDYRKYFAISRPRYSIAYRLVTGGSFGSDEQIFRIGGPLTFRGVDFGELVGTRAFYENTEFRFPLFPFAPIQYDFLTGVAFFDAADAWFNSDFEFNDIKTAYGLGIRLNMGGLFLLRWDFPINSGGPGTFFSIGIDY
ncbi:MAG: hypothetical protein ACE5HO_05630 [bacterium]